MAKVTIPKVGDVNFPDSMSAEDIRKHAGRLHRIAQISEKTGTVDVTASLPYARKAIAAGNNSPALAHFVASAEHLPSGRDAVDFATGRHALKATTGSGNDLTQAEFRRLLQEDLNDATSRAGTRSDWMEVDKPESTASSATNFRKTSAVLSALKERAAERNGS
jgi:hypothetical protein